METWSPKKRNDFSGGLEVESISTVARLKVFGKEKLFADLYIPEKVWKQLVYELDGNTLIVALRLEGEDGTKIMEAS